MKRLIIITLLLLASLSFGQSAGMDLNVDQGGTFSLNILLLDEAQDTVNISNWAAKFLVRKKINSPDTLLYASTANGYIVESSTQSGTFEITVPYSVMSALDFRNGYYGFEATQNGTRVYKIIKGRFKLSKEVVY